MDADPSGAGAVATGRDDRSRADRRVLVALVLIALLPIVGGAVRMHRAGWLPEGDDAMIARRTMAVFSSQPPITGQPSTAGNLFVAADGGRSEAAAIDASHPGPLEYYLLAVPYRLSGWSPTGLLAGVALINGAAAGAVVWLAWRRLGARGATAGVVAVLAVAAHLGTWNLARPLNASIAVLPLLAGLVALWAVLDGDRWAAVPGVAALSLVVQAHLGAAPLAAAALLAILLVTTWRLVADHRLRSSAAADVSDTPTSRPRDAPVTERGPASCEPAAGASDTPVSRPRDVPVSERVRASDGSPRHAWLVLVGVLAVTWLAVAIEQVTGSPGNVSRLVDVARLRVERAGPRFGFAAVVDRVVRPAWPGAPPLPRISIIGPIPLGPALAKGVLLALLLALVAAWAWRRGHPSIVRLVVVVAGAVLVPMAVLARGPDEVRLGPTYQLTSLVAVSGLVTFLLVVALADLLAPSGAATSRRRGAGPVALRGRADKRGGGMPGQLDPLVRPNEHRHLREGAASSMRPGSHLSARLLSVVAVLAVAALGVTVFGGPTYRDDNARTARLAAAIRAELPPGRYKLAATGTWAYLSSLDAVSVDLLRHGYDVRVVRLGAIPDEPQRRDTDVDAPTIMLDSTGAARRDGRRLVELPALTEDPTWAADLLAAVSRRSVVVRVRAERPGEAGYEVEGESPCARAAVAAAVDTETAAARRRLVDHILACSQRERRLAMAQVTWTGLDRFWVDLLGSNMPAPFPRSPLAAYLIPAG